MNNEFTKTLAQFGMEGMLGEYGEYPVSFEEEMNQEIATEAALDKAYSEMEASGIVAATSQVEAILGTMANRECGLESSIGRNPADVYAGFGITVGTEAVKDVVARKMYSGWASIKALINTCITWLKSLIGIQTASKKVFAGLKKKSTAMKKQLSKVQSKVSEKLKRDMPDYARAINRALSVYGPGLAGQRQASNASVQELAADILTMPEADARREIGVIDNAIETIKRTSEGLADAYDAKDTDEYEGSACYNHILTTLRSIESNADAYRSYDFAKIVDRNIKNLEKARKEADRTARNSNIEIPAEVSRYLNKSIELFTKQSGVMKQALKLIVKIADDALTMAKGIYATLV